MTQAQVDFLDEFNAAMEELCLYRCITRNSDLQRRACAQFETILRIVADEKQKVTASADEHFANVLLGCECLVQANIAEIKMYLALKEDQPDKAWDLLVDAQDGFASGMRADPGFIPTGKPALERLDRVEKIVFPPQNFLSTGWIVQGEICSICDQEYEDCEHVKGRPYMGQFCYVRLIGLRADHVSLVPEPASKHCRITNIGVKGGRRNVMTFCIEPNPEAAPGGTDADEGLQCGAILSTTGSANESC